MTNERELLEDAARAAGVNLLIVMMDKPGGGEREEFFNKFEDGRVGCWNPAHDDGDSDRLGTAIWANVTWHSDCVVVEVIRDPFARDQFVRAAEYFKDHNGDKQKALRWARLRCAAEIGRALKD